MSNRKRRASSFGIIFMCCLILTGCFDQRKAGWRFLFNEKKYWFFGPITFKSPSLRILSSDKEADLYLHCNSKGGTSTTLVFEPSGKTPRKEIIFLQLDEGIVREDEWMVMDLGAAPSPTKTELRPQHWLPNEIKTAQKLIIRFAAGFGAERIFQFDVRDGAAFHERLRDLCAKET